MNISQISQTVQKALKDNAPMILTAIGVTGTLTTAYLAAKASFKAARVLDENPSKGRELAVGYQKVKAYAKPVWKLYIPAAISGTFTVACIMGGAKIGAKRTAAAYSLLTVSEKAFGEYKEKVVEKIGKSKETAVRDEIAQDRVKNSPVVIVSKSGHVLCYELHTGRYFESDMETLRRAQNEINHKLIREMEVTLSDFYYMLGLPYTSYSSHSGWVSEKMMELMFSTVMSEDGRPCIAFDYNYIRPF